MVHFLYGDAIRDQRLGRRRGALDGSRARSRSRRVENELSVKGAIFWNNDPTGSLLAYRGFAIHDRQTGYRDRLPLPPTPSLEPGGLFEQQAPWVEPLFAIDDRPGYYGALA